MNESLIVVDQANEWFFRLGHSCVEGYWICRKLPGKITDGQRPLMKFYFFRFVGGVGDSSSLFPVTRLYTRAKNRTVEIITAQ